MKETEECGTLTKCSLCPEEGTFSNPFLSFDGKACMQWEIEAFKQLSNSDSCYLYHWIGVEHCGCSLTSVTETCNLCPDGSMPLNGDKVVPGFDAAPTCSDLVNVRAIDGNATCEAATSVLAAYCGCEGVVGCSLCPDGSIVEDPDRVELLHFQSCAFWEAQAQIQRYPDACDDLEIEFSYSAFCCSDVEAPNMCSFCGESGLSDETRVVFDDVTCGDLDTQAAFLLDDTICTELQSSYASFCCQSDILNGTEDPNSSGPTSPSTTLILPNEQVCSGFTATEIQ